MDQDGGKRHAHSPEGLCEQQVLAVLNGTVPCWDKRGVTVVIAYPQFGGVSVKARAGYGIQ